MKVKKRKRQPKKTIKRELSKKEKIMAAKILREEYAMSYRKIAKTLGICGRTAWKYVNLEIEDEDTRFFAAVKKMITLKEEELSAQTLQLLEKKMPKAHFRDLVGFYKVIRELRRPGTVIAQQFGNVTYVIQTTKDEKEFIDATSEPK